MFAKLFDTAYGQVVAIKQGDSEGDPEIRFFCQPSDLGVCSLAYGYGEHGWEVADLRFEEVDLGMAESAAKQINDLVS